MAEAGKLAGVSDGAVRKATGRGWNEWVELLDRAGARGMSHAEAATLLHSRHGLDGWWAQMVTVGYELAIGRRQANQTCDGDFQANGSRTYPVPVAKLFRAWSDAKLRARWLPEKGVTIRTVSPPKSFRMTWSDGRTSVEAWFTAKGPSKSAVGVQHRRLGEAREVPPLRDYWRLRLDALGDLLGG